MPRQDLGEQVSCPDCRVSVSARNLSRHRRVTHGTSEADRLSCDVRESIVNTSFTVELARDIRSTVEWCGTNYTRDNTVAIV